MATSPVQVQLGASGRLVIPARLRQELNLKPKDRLIVRVEDGRLFFEKREAIIHRLHTKFAEIGGDNMIHDLIAQRRREAQNES